MTHWDAAEECSALIGMYALDALKAVDMGSHIEWQRGKPHSAVIDGERMRCLGTFLGLEHHGYVKFEGQQIKLTEKGQQALRDWTNGRAGV